MSTSPSQEQGCCTHLQNAATAAHRYSKKLPAGVASYDPSKATHILQYDNSKGIKILGLKYRSIDEVTKDSLEDFKARGWI